MIQIVPSSNHICNQFVYFQTETEYKYLYREPEDHVKCNFNHHSKFLFTKRSVLVQIDAKFMKQNCHNITVYL